MTSSAGDTTATLLAVVNDFPSPSQTFVTRKLAGLRDRNWAIAVAASRFGPASADWHVPLLPLAPWSEPRAAATPTARAGWRAIRRGWRASADAPGATIRRRLVSAPLLGFDADIVHFEFSGIAVSYRSAIPALRPARVAVSCRGSAEQIAPIADPRRADALAEVFAAVDLIHCVCDDMARTVTAMGAPPDRILVNRPAVPVATLAGLRAGIEPHSGPLRVLSIGRLHWAKGLDDGVRAVALAAQDSDLAYRIVGDGPEREKLDFLVDRLGLSGRVEFTGAQTEAQVLEHLRWADVLLLPSLSEGISNAVLEAMAAGLPVVSTDCGGMSEVVTGGEDGELTAVGDTRAMADAILRLTDPAERDRLGRAAARRAERDFDLSRQIEVFDGAYRQLLAS